MELNYRLTNIDVNYDDARTALDKQKAMLAESVCELEAQNDTSGQIGMLMMQIDYLDTLLAQMNARREYEKETVSRAMLSPAFTSSPFFTFISFNLASETGQKIRSFR